MEGKRSGESFSYHPYLSSGKNCYQDDFLAITSNPCNDFELPHLIFTPGIYKYTYKEYSGKTSDVTFY